MKYAIGRQRKEDGKPCVTKQNNNTVMFEKIFCQTSPSFEQIFCKGPEHSYIKGRSQQNTHNSPVMFVTHKHFAVLFFLLH